MTSGMRSGCGNGRDQFGRGKRSFSRCQFVGYTISAMGEPDDLDTILRKYGGLAGLAREIGQGDPAAYQFEPGANGKPQQL